MNKARTFDGQSLTEQPDGSAVLLVTTRGQRRKVYEIHLAPHVYADIRFTIYRQYPDERVKAARLKEFEQGAARMSQLNDQKERGSWLWERCYACGHRLAFASTACPQCCEDFDGRKTPRAYPESCECDRCVWARVS